MCAAGAAAGADAASKGETIDTDPTTTTPDAASEDGDAVELPDLAGDEGAAGDAAKETEAADAGGSTSEEKVRGGGCVQVRPQAQSGCMGRNTYTCLKQIRFTNCSQIAGTPF